MILEGVFNMILILFRGIMSLVPTLEIALPPEVSGALGYLFAGVGFFVPVSALMPILAYDFVILNFRLIVAIVLRIKSFLPFMGGE